MFDLKIHSSYNTIFPRVDCYNPGIDPLALISAVISQEDIVSNNIVSGLPVPLDSTLQLLQVLMALPAPESF